MRRLKIAPLLLCFFGLSGAAQAEVDWSTLTVDNDIFVSSDSGYTNGIYYSWFDTPENNRAKPGLLAAAMLWSLSNDAPALFEVSAKTIGQTMVTPADITLDNPPLPPDALPYAGLLFFGDTYIKAYRKHADKIGVTIGLIGEFSLAEESQKLIHQATASDQPRGWHSQLDDELVFQLSRGRVWKSWTAANSRADILLGADAELGTLASSLAASVMFRYGNRLNRTFATALLADSRASNPVAADSAAADSGWYLFAGATLRYVANQIFLDGNTFDDDASIDYAPEQVGVSFGFAYSWKDIALTFAINDLDTSQSNSSSTEEYSRFGTFTLAWRHE